MKKVLSFFLALVLLAGIPCAAFAENGADTPAERGLAAIQATGHSDRLVLPKEESYLSEWKTLYPRKAFKAPCLATESAPKPLSGQIMPYLYEGVAATVVAEENDYSCVIFQGINYKQYVGWIKSIRLLEAFPGEEYTVGEKPEAELQLRNDVKQSWSQPGLRWLTTDQSYTILSEEVKDCCGFTLEYQLIAENTPYWDNILGPRKIYVKTAGEWVEVGEFPYSEFGAVKVQVWLKEPMDIEAIGTIAQCKNSEIFRFRQTATDFAIA